MKPIKISIKQIPSHWPIYGTVTGWLLLDRLNAAGWVWGVWGTIMVIAWIVLGFDIFNSKQVEVDLLRIEKGSEG
jgi:hypothetical protein